MNTTTETQQNGTTIRQDIMAVTDSTEQAGAVVWWELEGTVGTSALGNAWVAAGCDPDFLPDAVSERAALKRAMRSLAEKRKLVRPLSTDDGYSLVAETADGETLAYEQSITVTVDEQGQLKISPENVALSGHIRDAYAITRTEFDAGDISSMLVRYAQSLEAVALRARGGFYFLPPNALERFRKAAGAIKGVSGHQFFEIPAMQTKSLVAAVLASVQREAAAEIAAFEEALSDGTSGARALRTKTRECEAVATKVSHYETLLGTSLTALQGQLNGLRARLAEAAIMATADAAAA